VVIVHPWSLLFTVLRGYLQLFAIPAMIGSLHEPSSGNGRPQELRMRKLDGGLSIHWFLQFFNGLLGVKTEIRVFAHCQFAYALEKHALREAAILTSSGGSCHLKKRGMKFHLT
jgi:hypothetical protein